MEIGPIDERGAVVSGNARDRAIRLTIQMAFDWTIAPGFGHRCCNGLQICTPLASIGTSAALHFALRFCLITMGASDWRKNEQPGRAGLTLSDLSEERRRRIKPLLE
jgi:hypothetical protein